MECATKIELLSFEQLRIGDRWQSRARTITESDVVHFAGLTGDYDPLHVDHEFARQSPFGKPIAHGLLGLSILAGLSSNCPAVRTAAFLGIREWEFVRPTYIGDTVHAITEVVDLQRSGRRRGRVIWRRQLLNQSGDVVQSGILETLVNAADTSNRRDAPTPAAPAPHIISTSTLAHEPQGKQVAQ